MSLSYSFYQSQYFMVVTILICWTIAPHYIMHFFLWYSVKVNTITDTLQALSEPCSLGIITLGTIAAHRMVSPVKFAKLKTSPITLRNPFSIAQLKHFCWRNLIFMYVVQVCSQVQPKGSRWYHSFFAYFLSGNIWKLGAWWSKAGKQINCCPLSPTVKIYKNNINHKRVQECRACFNVVESSNFWRLLMQSLMTHTVCSGWC